MQTPSRVATVLVVTVGSLLMSAGAASAGTPVTWEDPVPESKLHYLMIFGGGTLGLIVVLSLFALLITRQNYVPPDPSTALELHAGTQPELTSTD